MPWQRCRKFKSRARSLFLASWFITKSFCSNWKRAGFHQIAETGRAEVPDAPQVVITAHGISQRRRQELVQAGKTLIDTTCPLVARVHRAAQQLARAGAFVVVIGHPEHVEVQGITGDLEAYAVVPNTTAVCGLSLRKNRHRLSDHVSLC